MSEFRKYTRDVATELRPYIEGENLDGVSISPYDIKHGSPKLGDYIARDPDKHTDTWLVSAEYFAKYNFKVRE